MVFLIFSEIPVWLDNIWGGGRGVVLLCTCVLKAWQRAFFCRKPLSEYFLLGLFKPLNCTGVMSNLVISLCIVLLPVPHYGAAYIWRKNVLC